MIIYAIVMPLLKMMRNEGFLSHILLLEELEVLGGDN
jgi:hypothetical protein